VRDADELGDLITNREEAMAAETMLTNGCIMKHIADDVDKGDEMEIRFYSEDANPATYTPTTKWDASGAKIRRRPRRDGPYADQPRPARCRPRVLP